MTISVSVTPAPYAQATSLVVTWDVRPDGSIGNPNAVSIAEYDAAMNQIEATGKISLPSTGPIVFQNLTPNTIYYYEFCTYTSDGIPDCSAWNQYSGRTEPTSSPTPQQTEVQIVAVQPFPRRLIKPQGLTYYVTEGNGFSLAWIASGPIEPSVALYDASGVFLKGLNIGGDPQSSGSVADFGVPTPGAAYSVAIRGYLPGGQVTEWSPRVNFTAPVNTRSLQEFLTGSNLKGSNGIKQLLPASAPGQPLLLRTVMEV